MLERVAAHCLESSGLRLLQGGRPQKRILHSALWVHGAGELEIGVAVGASCAGEGAAALPENPSAQQQPANTARRRPENAPLDFLYPSGALAFFWSLSRAVPRRQGAPAFVFRSRKRNYSTSTPISTSAAASPETTAVSTSTESNQDIEPAKEAEPPENSELQIELPQLFEKKITFKGQIRLARMMIPRPPGDKYRHLRHLFAYGVGGEYESMWYHFMRYRRPNRSTVWTVAEYLLMSSRRVEWFRAFTAVKRLLKEDWGAKEFEILVKAMLRLDNMNYAMFYLKESLLYLPDSRDSGFEYYMRHHIMLGDWDKVVEAYTLLRSRPLGESEGGGDRRWRLNNSAMTTLRDPASAARYITQVMKWAETIPRLQEGEKTKNRSIEDDLAENLMKGCLNWITRPRVKDETNMFREVFEYIKGRKGWLLTTTLLERAVGFLAGNFRDAEAIELYFELRYHKPKRVSNVVMNKVLLCLSRLNDFAGMQVIFNDFYAFSEMRRPDKLSFSILMASVARRGDSSALNKLLQTYVKDTVMSTPQEVSHMMQVHAVRGELQDVVSWFNRMSDEFRLKPDVISYNILINAYSKDGDVDGAARRVQEMLSIGLKPDQTTYNIILHMCAMRGDVMGADNIFNLISTSGFEPDVYAYTGLACAYTHVKDMARADALLNSIVDMSFKISPTPVWNTVLSAHAAMGNTERVNEIFALMNDKGVPFDYNTYGIVMHSLCLAGKMEAAEDTLNYMKEAGFAVTADKYHILMVGYTRLKDFRAVWETFKRMLDDGIKADYNTLAVLLKSYAQAEVQEYEEHPGGNDVVLESTERILEEVTSEIHDLDLASFDPVKTATPPWLFTPLINVYYVKSAWERATNIFKRFLQVSTSETYGASPDLSMYKAMMRVYRGGGDLDGMRSMWEGLKLSAIRLHKKPDASTAADTQPEIFAHFQLELCEPLSIVIRALSDAQDLPALELEIESLQRCGYVLDNVNWNDYVQALALAGELVRAAEICERKLMQRWREVRTYFLFADVAERGGEGKVLPPIRPFVRTVETLATELRILDRRRRLGDEEAKATLIKIYRDSPTTWEACDGLENMEGRASKEMMFRLQREAALEAGGSGAVPAPTPAAAAGGRAGF